MNFSKPIVPANNRYANLFQCAKLNMERIFQIESGCVLIFVLEYHLEGRKRANSSFYLDFASFSNSSFESDSVLSSAICLVRMELRN